VPFWCSTTEIHRDRPLRLEGDAYLIISKAGVTRTYAKESKNSPRAVLEEFSKSNTNAQTINLLRKYFCM